MQNNDMNINDNDSPNNKNLKTTKDHLSPYINRKITQSNQQKYSSNNKQYQAQQFLKLRNIKGSQMNNSNTFAKNNQNTNKKNNLNQDNHDQFQQLDSLSYFNQNYKNRNHHKNNANRDSPIFIDFNHKISQQQFQQSPTVKKKNKKSFSNQFIETQHCLRHGLKPIQKICTSPQCNKYRELCSACAVQDIQIHQQHLGFKLNEIIKNNINNNNSSNYPSSNPSSSPNSPQINQQQHKNYLPNNGQYQDIQKRVKKIKHEKYHINVQKAYQQTKQSIQQLQYGLRGIQYKIQHEMQINFQNYQGYDQISIMVQQIKKQIEMKIQNYKKQLKKLYQKKIKQKLNHLYNIVEDSLQFLEQQKMKINSQKSIKYLKPFYTNDLHHQIRFFNSYLRQILEKNTKQFQTGFNNDKICKLVVNFQQNLQQIFKIQQQQEHPQRIHAFISDGNGNDILYQLKVKQSSRSSKSQNNAVNFHNSLNFNNNPTLSINSSQYHLSVQSTFPAQKLNFSNNYQIQTDQISIQKVENQWNGVLQSIFYPQKDCYYIFGQGTNKQSSLIQRYSPGSAQHRILGNMEVKRKNFAVCLLKNEIYIIGGQNDKQGCLMKCQKYVPHQNRTYLISSLNYKSSRHSLTTFKNKFIIKFGGTHHMDFFIPNENQNIAGHSSKQYQFDPKQGIWFNKKQLLDDWRYYSKSQFYSIQTEQWQIIDFPSLASSLSQSSPSFKEPFVLGLYPVIFNIGSDQLIIFTNQRFKDDFQLSYMKEEGDQGQRKQMQDVQENNKNGFSIRQNIQSVNKPLSSYCKQEKLSSKNKLINLNKKSSAIKKNQFQGSKQKQRLRDRSKRKIKQFTHAIVNYIDKRAKKRRYYKYTLKLTYDQKQIKQIKMTKDHLNMPEHFYTFPFKLYHKDLNLVSFFTLERPIKLPKFVKNKMFQVQAREYKKQQKQNNKKIQNKYVISINRIDSQTNLLKEDDIFDNANMNNFIDNKDYENTKFKQKQRPASSLKDKQKDSFQNLVKLMHLNLELKQQYT